MIKGIFAALLLLVGSAAFAQSSGPVGSRLAWDQSGPNLATVQAYRFRAAFNGGSFVLVTATCSGSASPFSCTTPLTLAAGTHTARVSAAQVVGGVESPQAVSVVFNFTLTPLELPPPGNLHLIPPQQVTVDGTVISRFPWGGLDVAQVALDVGGPFYFGAPLLQAGTFSVRPGDRMTIRVMGER